MKLCLDCGMELTEQEESVCDTCYDIQQADLKDERRNPDE